MNTKQQVANELSIPLESIELMLEKFSEYGYVLKKVLHTDRSSVNCLSDPKVIKELKKKFPGADVDAEVEEMLDWLESTGKKKKNYVAFARNWIRRDYVEPEKKVNSALITSYQSLED